MHLCGLYLREGDCDLIDIKGPNNLGHHLFWVSKLIDVACMNPAVVTNTTHLNDEVERIELNH